MAPEKLWTGKPSQLINWLVYCVVIGGSLIIDIVLHRIDHDPYHFIYSMLEYQIFTDEAYLLFGLAIVMVLLIGYGVLTFLSTWVTTYWLTEERLFVKRLRGFSIHIDEIELYRIYEYSVLKNLFLNLFGLGTILIEAHDETDPQLYIRGIRHVEQVAERIRAQVEAVKTAKGVRDLNIHGGGGTPL